MLKSYKLAKDKENTKLNNCLLILIMTDYLFTYYGINHLNVIVEANPLLVSFFSLPFGVSFFLRLAYATVLVLMSKFLYYKEYKYYNLFIAFAIGINTIVTFIHIRWVVIIILGLN